MDDALRERRKRRMLELLREQKAVELVEILGVPADYISRIKTGRKGLGEELARKWEAILRKPEYWFDKTDAELQAAHVAEPKASYHGVFLTRSGALLAAEWEKLDVSDRIEIEAEIHDRVARKMRGSRRPKGEHPPRE